MRHPRGEAAEPMSSSTGSGICPVDPAEGEGWERPRTRPPGAGSGSGFSCGRHRTRCVGPEAFQDEPGLVAGSTEVGHVELAIMGFVDALSGFERTEVCVGLHEY